MQVTTEPDEIPEVLDTLEMVVEPFFVEPVTYKTTVVAVYVGDQVGDTVGFFVGTTVGLGVVASLE